MHITRKRLRRATAGAFLYVQQFVRELEAFFEQMDREWYSDDPEWQKSHQDADSARAEQRAAREYLANRSAAEYTENKENDETKEDEKNLWDRIREGFQELYEQNSHSVYDDLLAARSQRDAEEERREMAADSSTQAALEEKLAEKGYWNKFAAEEYAKDNETAIGSGALYNEQTGQIYIPASNDNKTGTWEAYSMRGKVHVDPKVESRFRVLSNGIATVMTGATAAITKKPSVIMLQPIITNLIEAGMLSREYKTQDYVMNNPHTNEVGITLTGAMGVSGGGTISLAADCYGNIAIMHSNDYGAGTPGASAGIFHSKTNAPFVEYLQGMSVAVGGSGGAGFSLGADVIGFCNPDTGEAYYGWAMSGGLSLWPAGVPVEMHGKVSYTTIENMISLMDVIYPEKEK